jgi:hypothetical protein
LDLQQPVQSEPIISNVVSSNPAHDRVYSIQHFKIKFVSDLRQVGGFLHQYNYNVTEILLKVALNTIKQTNNKYMTAQIIFFVGKYGGIHLMLID